MIPESEFREESDSLGSLRVPSNELYGVHTGRAILNFPIGSERTIGDFSLLIKGILKIKAAASLANFRCGLISEDVCRSIRRAVDDLISQYDPRHYPIHHLHGGGGTSANMNVNEVVANQAEEFLGGRRGEYMRVSPVKTVNLNQSTNDVYPTACHLALIWGWDNLRKEMAAFHVACQDLAERGRGHKRYAKSCLQDALEIAYGDLFDGYCAVLARSAKRVEDAVQGLFYVNLGGTMVGRREDVPAGYFERIIPILKQEAGLDALERQSVLFDAAQNLDDMVHVSNQLALFSRSLMKICKDLRLLTSGPLFGFREISIAPVQEGSSFKAGKYNPVIAEFVIQSCLMVLGNDAASSSAVENSELDVSVWESLVVFRTLNSMELIENALQTLRNRCVGGICPTPVNRDALDVGDGECH